MKTEKTDRKSFKKYSAALARDLCDRVESGLSVAEICKTHSDYFPDETTIYRWKKRYPEFKKQLDEAYQIFFYKKIDEIEILSKELLDFEKDLKETEGKEPGALKGWSYARRAHQDAIRMRLDTLKFILAKLAPKLVNDLRDIPTNQLAVVPVVQVISYADQSALKDDTKQLT